MSTAIILSLLLIAVLVNAEWVQPRSNSHRSNLSPTTSSKRAWTNERDRVYQVSEVILTGDQLVVVAKGWGFCYAPNYFFVDKDTGAIQEQYMAFNCLRGHSNVVADGEVYSVIVDRYPTHSFLINEQGFVPGFNQTAMVKEVLMIAPGRILFNNRFEVTDENTLKLYDIARKMLVWTLVNQTTGSVTVGTNDDIYALSVDRSHILVISSATGIIDKRIDLYGAITSAQFIIPTEGDFIYTVELENVVAYIRAYNPKLKNTGYVWTSKPFGSNYEMPTVALDNTGKFIVIIDTRNNELSIINTADGATVFSLTNVNYVDVGITQNNEIVAVSLNRADVISVEGNVIRSVKIQYGEKCVLDLNALYCCMASYDNEFERLRCSKTIL